MSDTLFQTAIADILIRHGIDVTNDPVRLRNLLRDYCTSESCRREINVTVQCARSGLLASMREVDARTPPEARLNRLVGILHEDYGVDQVLARNVIGTWIKLFAYLQSILKILRNSNVSLNQIGNAEVQNRLGDCFYYGKDIPGDYVEAFKWYRKAADQGYATAQSNLGWMYANGRGVPKDEALACEWYRQAADQGDATAQFNLGVRNANGRGVPKDEALACEWYRKAADQGYANAQSSLGWMYENGWGVPKDEALACEWYRKAADQGDEDAQAKLDIYCDKEQGVQQAVAFDELPLFEDEKPEPGAVQTFDLGGGVSLELVWCPPGEFIMGSPAGEEGRGYDEVQHQVTLTKGFWLGKYPVTQRQWETVMGNNPSRFKVGEMLGLFVQEKTEHPVENVSWDDCQAFCGKLNEKLAAREDARPGVAAGERASPRAGEFRLPTEAEWEYACRAGTVGPFAGDLDDMGWYASNSGKTTHPVGQKRANAWGLCDMHGNVWEWCEDWYGNYPSGSVTDPVGAASGSYRVARGGRWSGYASHCRSAIRVHYHPDYRIGYIGLRVVRILP